MRIDDDVPSPVVKTNSELQGANQLLIDAIISISQIVESLHHRINGLSALTGRPRTEQTSGLAGLIYKGIRGLTEVIGNSIDGPLALINQVLSEPPHSAKAFAVQSVLNGVLGDYLLARNNALAIDMHFNTAQDRLNTEQLEQFLEQATKHKHTKLLIMVHGLCLNHLQWTHKDHNYAERLAAQLGYTTVYLNYNSGLHISQNGQQFSALLETLNTMVSAELQICVVAHSMGGLVARSACYYAEKRGATWPGAVQKMVFLGTPHHGAPLEKTGNWLDMLLGAHPYTAPFGQLIKVRSSGITDLRYGNIREEDWQERNPFDFSRDCRIPTPLPADIECYALAGSLQIGGRGYANKVLGDGLVTVDSALGWHQSKPFTLKFAAKNQCHIKGINHMQLLGAPEVYARLVEWLKTD